MKLAGTNFAFVWTETLDEGLSHLANIGVERVELTVSLPHVNLNEPVSSTAKAINESANRHGVSFSSVNPVEMNLISANEAVAETTVDELTKSIDLAADIGAPTLVVVPGRYNSLCPMSPEVALESFQQRLTRLLEHAEKRQVSLALENTPFGFLQTPLELLQQVQHFDHYRLGIVVDAANLHFVGANVSEVSAVAEHLFLTHVSDTYQSRFAHNHLGDGDVDFKAFAQTLESIGYEGETVYELVTPGVDWNRWKSDFDEFRSMGWL